MEFKERIKEKGFRRSSIQVRRDSSAYGGPSKIRVPERVQTKAKETARGERLEARRADPQPMPEQVTVRVSQLRKFQKEHDLSDLKMKTMIMQLAKDSTSKEERDGYLEIGRTWGQDDVQRKKALIDRAIKENPHIDLRPDPTESRIRRTQGISDYA